MANFIDKMRQTIHQPHEMSEIERVIENMSQIEVQIQQKFTEIGQYFYMTHTDSEELDDKYKELVEAVRKLDENRKSFYSHKLRLEGNMKCVNCGEIIPYGSIYCSVCGKRADQKEE